MIMNILEVLFMIAVIYIFYKSFMFEKKQWRLFNEANQEYTDSVLNNLECLHERIRVLEIANGVVKDESNE